jgi:hypothetical protein
MKLNAWNRLSLRVMALFATAMLVSYSPDLFRTWLFEDKLIQPSETGYVWKHSFMGIDEDWDWGYRHYLYFWMCIVLFVIQAVRLFKWIGRNEKDFK